MADSETSRTDYAQTVAVWSQLVDVRFRLLALVPTLTAIGVWCRGENMALTPPWGG